MLFVSIVNPFTATHIIVENAPRGKPEGRDFPGDFKNGSQPGRFCVILESDDKSIINEGRGQHEEKS